MNRLRSDVGRDEHGDVWVTSEMAAQHVFDTLGWQIAAATVRSWARYGHVRRSPGANHRRLVHLEDVQKHAAQVQTVARP